LDTTERWAHEGRGIDETEPDTSEINLII